MTAGECRLFMFVLLPHSGAPCAGILSHTERRRCTAVKNAQLQQPYTVHFPYDRLLLFACTLRGVSAKSGRGFPIPEIGCKAGDIWYT